MADNNDVVNVDAPVIKRPKQSVIASFFKSSNQQPTASSSVELAADPTSMPLPSTSRPSPSAAIMPSTSRVSTDVAHPDIADALQLRREGKLTPEQKLRFIRNTLKVPSDYAFPSTSCSGRKYYVSHKHTSGRYECFYFSPKLNGLLCLPCLLFAPDGVGRGHQSIGKLVTVPLCSFKKLTGKDSYLDTHLIRDYHDYAVTRMSDFVRSNKEGGDIRSKLSEQHSQQVDRNRAILRAVIHEIETCGRLNLALRGHRDSGPLAVPDNAESVDYTQGTLRAFLQKASLNNIALADHLRHGPRNASYISAETQNHLISSIGSVLFRKISSEIQASSFFAIQADSELAIANAITEPGFMVCIHILQRILGVTKGLSVVLQSKKMNFISALEEIDNVVATLQTWRSDEKDEEFCSVFASAEQLFAYAEMLPSANIPLPRLAGRQRNRTNVPAASSMEYYKRAAWYPFLDAVLAELHERFNQHSTAALRMAAIIPANCVDAPFASLEPSINRYGPLLPDGFEGIRQEFLRWQRKWQANAVDQRPSTLPEAMSRCDPTVYPNVAVLSEIFSTIPVTTATAERSFSQLRLLKNYMRTTMVEERLNGLAFMAIRKDIRFAYDDVIDQYALDYNPRMKFQ